MSRLAVSSGPPIISFLPALFVFSRRHRAVVVLFASTGPVGASYFRISKSGKYRFVLALFVMILRVNANRTLFIYSAYVVHLICTPGCLIHFFGTSSSTMEPMHKTAVSATKNPSRQAIPEKIHILSSKPGIHPALVMYHHVSV